MLRLADDDGLAAGLLDRFLGGVGELVRVDGDCGLDLSVVEYFDEAVLLAEQAKGDDLVEGELRDILGSGDFGDAVEAEDLVLDSEDVGKAALRQAAVKGHLTAFEATHERGPRTGALTLVSAGGGFAHARTHTAADALLVFVRLLGGAEIGEITNCHSFLA